MHIITRVRRHPIGLLALFLALGGTAYAATTLPRNSVGTKQIKTGAVTSAKVKDGSLRAADFRAGELPAGASGQAGAKGDRGDKGDRGVPGPTAASFTSHDPSNADPPVAVNFTSAEEVQVLALTDGAGPNGASGGLLQMPFAGRVLTNASITLDNTGGGTDVAICRTKIAPQGGEYVVAGQPIAVSLATGQAAQIPLVSGAERPAGAYNVQVACKVQGSGVTMRFLRGNMTVLATG